MNDFKLTFTLKQHTPLIHFQHDQAGATLRATELKPKLDRFILTKLGGGNYEHGVAIAKEKGWLIGNDTDKPALDYKVRIEAKDKDTTLNDIINAYSYYDKKKNERKMHYDNLPTFFGNMMKPEEYDSGEKKPKKVTFYNDIKLYITCFIPELISEIENHFPEFLFKTNFGTRQSKGFGSFTVDKESDFKGPYLKLGEKLTLRGRNYQNDTNISLQDIFEIINYYHQRLKSGINYSYYNRNNNISFCHYKKAFIRDYVYNKYTYEWDKKWLKEKFLNINGNDNEKKFVRALLGLSYDYKFGTRKNNCHPEGLLPDYPVDISIDTEEKEIQRIKSPLLYKPIKINNEWRIYILIDDEHLVKNRQMVTNYEFDFVGNGKTEHLKTPNEIFDFSDVISQYHLHLGKTFDAVNFTGKNKYKIEIK